MERKLGKICFVFFIACWCQIISSMAIAKEEYIDIPHHSQESLCNCGATVVQMWSYKILGWAPSQSDIAGWGCGFDSYQVELQLEKWTGKSFDVNGHSGEKSAREKIYKELIEQERPLAINGTTVRANGDTRPGGHWLLINGASVSGKNNGYKISWVSIMDPLAGSQWEGSYQVLRPGSKVSADTLFKKHWLPYKGTDKRQSVDD